MPDLILGKLLHSRLVDDRRLRRLLHLIRVPEVPQNVDAIIIVVAAVVVVVVVSFVVVVVVVSFRRVGGRRVLQRLSVQVGSRTRDLKIEEGRQFGLLIISTDMRLD